MALEMAIDLQLFVMCNWYVYICQAIIYFLYNVHFVRGQTSWVSLFYVAPVLQGENDHQ